MKRDALEIQVCMKLEWENDGVKLAGYMLI
jgi:hypothetical protein